jgi:hypothetical protein
MEHRVLNRGSEQPVETGGSVADRRLRAPPSRTIIKTETLASLERAEVDASLWGIGPPFRSTLATYPLLIRKPDPVKLRRPEGIALSDLNRRAKYYRLTSDGRKHLVREQSKWKLLVKTIARVMRPA